jgi:hypothetical protein
LGWVRLYYINSYLIRQRKEQEDRDGVRELRKKETENEGRKKERQKKKEREKETEKTTFLLRIYCSKCIEVFCPRWFFTLLLRVWVNRKRQKVKNTEKDQKSPKGRKRSNVAISS